MGNIRKLRRSIKPGMVISDTGVMVNGCKVFLGHSDAGIVSGEAKSFRVYLNTLLVRGRCITIGEMYKYSFDVRDKILSGEWFWN